MCLVTNRCAARKALLFFDQSDKNPDSGLRADDAESKCIRRPFTLASKTKREEGVPDRRLRKKLPVYTLFFL